MFILKGYKIGFSIEFLLWVSSLLSGFAYGFDQNHARIWHLTFPQARKERRTVVLYCVTVVYNSLYVTAFFVVILQSLNHDLLTHVC
jgi:hypothetical protein